MAMRESVCGAIRRPGMPWSASAPWRLWKHTMSELAVSQLAESEPPKSELARQIERYLADLTRAGSSAHTVRAYDADLRQFLEYLSPPDLAPPEPCDIDLLLLREWLGGLYRDRLEAVTIRRK